MFVETPESSEFDAYYQQYIDKVNFPDLSHEFTLNHHKMQLFVLQLAEDKWSYAYEEGKWTVADVLMHCSDVEDMFMNRILNIVRGTAIEFQSFDHDVMAEYANANELSKHELMDIYSSRRAVTMALLDTLSDEDFMKKGSVEGKSFSVRALVYAMIGHERHHMEIIKERYL